MTARLPKPALAIARRCAKSRVLIVLLLVGIVVSQSSLIFSRRGHQVAVEVQSHEPLAFSRAFAAPRWPFHNAYRGRAGTRTQIRFVLPRVHPLPPGLHLRSPQSIVGRASISSGDSRHSSAEDKAAVLKFGKHKGRTFADVAANEPGYASWALKQPNPSGVLLEFVRYLKAAQVETSAEVLLAYPSKAPLQAWEVHTVEFEPNKRLGENEMEEFCGKLWWRAHTAKEVAATWFCRSVVFFASPPSKEVIEQVGGAEAFVSNRSKYKLQPHKDEDWPVYKALLQRKLLQELQQHGHEVSEGSGALLIPEGKCKVPVLDGRSICSVVRYAELVLNRHVDDTDTCTLLVRVGIKQKLHATSSVASMQAEGEVLLGRQVRPIKPPGRGGILCKPEERGTIGEVRLLRNKRQSLLDYHRRLYPARRPLLAAAAAATPAVGVKSESDGKILDWPPQLLEPAWRTEDMDKDAVKKLKHTPAEWLETAQRIRRDYLSPCTWLNGIELEQTLFRPAWHELTKASLQDGVEISKLRIQALFGQSVPAQAQADFLKPLHEHFPRGWEFFPSQSYDDAADADRLEVQLEHLLDSWSLPTNTVVLAFLPAGATKPAAYRKAIKNAAAAVDLPSQCVGAKAITDENKVWWARCLKESINAKAGGQSKLDHGLATEGTLFIGFDVGRCEKVSIAASVSVAGCNGRVLQRDQVMCQKGEAISPKFLRALLMKSLERAAGEHTKIRRVVIARDGRFVKNEVAELSRTLRERQCLFDLVEVTKSGPELCRAIKIAPRQRCQAKMVKSGTYMKLTPNSAILCTSGVPTHSHLKGLNRPLLITKRAGDSDLDKLVEENYKLSRLTPYTLKSTRLPIHLHLADRFAQDIGDGVRYPRRPGMHSA